ncbi:YobI family P-loop NTPase [Paenibacillus sp. YSY-4.3]
MKPNSYKFQKLTPIKNADLKIYGEALDFVFQEEGLRNVAITGPYGAGKSSVLESYEYAHPDKRFLHISLAHFESVNIELKNDEDIENSTNDAVLEGKILNQLIHQINPYKIPQTQFKVKRPVSKYKLWFVAVLTTLSLIFLGYLLGFNAWRSFVQNLSSEFIKKILIYTTYEGSLFLAGISFIAILMYGIFSLIKIQYNRNMFKKVNIQGNEIEIFSDVDESYFDKYLNEVLYLFENADAEVIVFEDIDRFNSNQIFEKLREINFLVNKKTDKIIRFFYLLRDDIFTSKDRAKFFDFMIPIVPVVDGTNSYDQFINHFIKGGIIQTFDQDFLQGLSLYIDDMRILKNIYNEYVIYHDRIQSTELDCNKLLAMIAYKNIFPRDFSELQLSRGFVHNLFAKKSNFIEEEKCRLETEILKKQEQIQAAENEVCILIDELDVIFFQFDGLLDIDGAGEGSYKSRAAFIRAMKNNPDNIYRRNIHGNRYRFNFNEEYNKMSQDAKYIERKQSTQNKSVSMLGKLKQEVSELQETKTLLESKKLREIINKQNINKIFITTFTNEIGEEFSFNDVKSSPYFPLIKYLIRNGYIDESYSDYMTYFYEHSLSRVDKIFLRSVTDEIAKEFTYQLKDPALVVSRLRDVDFDSEESLNFYLLDYLLKSNHKNLSRFLNQLRDNVRFDFIWQYWSRGQEKPTFIQSLNHAWPLVWKGILVSDHFSENHKQQYALDTLYYSTDKDIIELNVDQCMTRYISNNKRFLNIDEPDIPKIISKLRLLDVKFKQIDYETSDPSLFKTVYGNNLYQLNISMIYLILNKIYRLPENENYQHKNYTLVSSKPEESLVRYVKNNIEHYIEIIFDHCNSIITDDENAALELLNNADISANPKLTYIEYLQTTIEKLDSVVDQEFWSALLQHRNVLYSEYNILQYYFSYANKLDDNLIEFINGDVTSISMDYGNIKANFGISEVEALYEDIIQCNELMDEKYEDFIKSSNNWKYEDFTFEGISGSKLETLIKYNIISMNEINLQFMRANYPVQLISFIFSNIEQYVMEVINNENFELFELLRLLDKDIQDTYKLRLLEYTSEPITVKGKKYSESILLHILKNNLEIDDIPYLISYYDRCSPKLKIVFETIFIQNIEKIILDEYEVPYILLIEFLGSDMIEESNKTDLLLSHLVDLNEKQAIICFRLLGMLDIVGLFSGKWPKLEKNDTNEKILITFKTKGWISGFDTDKREPEYFRARGRRNREHVTFEL